MIIQKIKLIIKILKSKSVLITASGMIGKNEVYEIVRIQLK